MEIRHIRKQRYRFLRQELDLSVTRGIITEEERDRLLEQYEESPGLNIVRVLVTIGAVLMGLGFMLFVAASWDAIPDPFKVVLLATMFAAALSASYCLLRKRPITSHALLYLAVLIFGAGVFLVNSAYNLDAQSNILLSFWIMPALILAWQRKEHALFMFAHVLLLIMMIIDFTEAMFFPVLPMLALIVLVNHRLGYRKAHLFATLSVALFHLLQTFAHIDLLFFHVAVVFLVIGIVLYHVPLRFRREVFRTVGLLTLGTAGFFLSFKSSWATLGFIETGTISSLLFTLPFVFYLLYLTTRRHIIALVFLGALIMRYYFDAFYETLSRALFFFVGGLFLLVFGYILERYRQKTSVKQKKEEPR